MQTLIDDLLTFSRVGRRNWRVKKLNLNQILQSALDNLERSIRESKAKISSDLLPEVSGDDSQMILLFQNLIGNAIKFCKKDCIPEVEIKVKKEENFWLFSVADNGIGIKKDYFDKIFVIFQRLHSKIEYPGSGIGLAICKRTVEYLGGKIWVESNVGEGSVFYFTLPH